MCSFLWWKRVKVVNSCLIYSIVWKSRLDHRYHSQGCSRVHNVNTAILRDFSDLGMVSSTHHKHVFTCCLLPKRPKPHMPHFLDRWLSWLPRSAKSWQKPSRWSLELNNQLLCNVRDEPKKNLVLHNRGPSLNITRGYKKGTYCVITWLFLDLSTLISPSSWTYASGYITMSQCLLAVYIYIYMYIYIYVYIYIYIHVYIHLFVSSIYIVHIVWLYITCLTPNYKCFSV